MSCCNTLTQLFLKSNGKISCFFNILVQHCSPHTNITNLLICIFKFGDLLFSHLWRPKQYDHSD